MGSSLHCRWIAVGLTAALAAGAAGQDSTSQRELNELHSAILLAAERAPDPALVVTAARARLTANLARLEQFLAGGGEPAAGRWSQWLRLPELRALATTPQPDRAALEDIQGGFQRNQHGLELPEFTAVRTSLRGLLAAAEYAEADAPSELFAQRMAELDDLATRLSRQPTSLDSQRAGALLAWLEALSDETAPLARQMRARFCATNGVVQFSGRLANVLLARNVEERNVVAATILGNYTWGVAIMRGDVSFGVIPNQDGGKLEVRLQGQALCPDNVAERRRISVHSSATTSIFANKQVTITDLGLQLDPASAFCSTSAGIDDVEARRRIMERLAWRRASRMLPEAEEAAARRAEAEASSKLDQQADAALAGMNNVLSQKIRAPLIRMSALPAALRFWTDASHLRLSLTQCSDRQLAPAGPPPQLSDGFDVAGGVHESLLNNLCESLLGGQTIEDKVWHDMLQICLGNPPRALWVHDRTERWSVTFAKERPVDARFDGERIAFTLRLARVTRGTQQFKGLVEIEGCFAPQITRDGPLLLRSGPLTIRVDRGLVPDDERQWLAFLTRKFDAVFPPRLSFDGLAPPEGGALGKLRRLELAEFQSHGGWLTIGYRLVP